MGTRSCEVTRKIGNVVRKCKIASANPSLKTTHGMVLIVGLSLGAAVGLLLTVGLADGLAEGIVLMVGLSLGAAVGWVLTVGPLEIEGPRLPSILGMLETDGD